MYWEVFPNTLNVKLYVGPSPLTRGGVFFMKAFCFSTIPSGKSEFFVDVYVPPDSLQTPYGIFLESSLRPGD